MLRVELTVPAELDNTYANRIGEVDWVFHLEAFQESQLTARKLWSDGNANHTGDTITVNLLRDGKIAETQELSAANGWAYTFDRLVEGHTWTVEEALEIPVILSSGCADPYSAKTVRASMGAIFRTPPQMGEPQAVLDACRAQKIPLAVTALSHQAVDIRQGNPAECAVVIGSEGRGVSAAFLQAAQRQLIIPMHPRCESLNAAIAAAIVMWQMRQ